MVDVNIVGCLVMVSLAFKTIKMNEYYFILLKMKPEFNDRHVKTSVFHMAEITELQE